MAAAMLGAGSVALASTSSGCAREEAPGVLAPDEAANTGQWAGRSPQSAPAAANPSVLSPSVGMVCSHDAEPQCPFGRCIAGRCGGCASASDCKPGAACLWTPLGPSCVFAGFPGAAPTNPTPLPTANPLPTGGSFSAARQICVDRTNEFRARVGMRPLVRRTQSEPCIDQQAQSDAQTRVTHGAFGRCGEFAQNECPGWGASPESTATSCLQGMFNEGPGQGPGHGHYNNMTSSKYASVACGFFIAPDGKTWLLQDFF